MNFLLFINWLHPINIFIPELPIFHAFLQLSRNHLLKQRMMNIILFFEYLAFALGRGSFDRVVWPIKHG